MIVLFSSSGIASLTRDRSAAPRYGDISRIMFKVLLREYNIDFSIKHDELFSLSGVASPGPGITARLPAKAVLRRFMFKGLTPIRAFSVGAGVNVQGARVLSRACFGAEFSRTDVGSYEHPT